MSGVEIRQLILDLGPPLAPALAVSALFATRAIRVHRLRKLLGQPACELPKSARRWVKTFPKEVKLGSRAPLREALYACFRAHPQLFAPARIRETLESGRAKGGKDALLDADALSGGIARVAVPAQQADSFPVEAVAKNLLSNLTSVFKGKKKLRHGLEHAILDSLGPGGGFAGFKLGAVVALMLAPFVAQAEWIAIPALMFLGAWLGTHLGKMIGTTVKARHTYRARRQLRNASKELKTCFLQHFPELIARFDQIYEARIARTQALCRRRQNRLARLLYPDLMTVFLRECVRRLRKDWIRERKQWREIKMRVRLAPPLQIAGAIHRISKDGVVVLPALAEREKAYEQALKCLQEAEFRDSA